jgi:ArsR family transcriptional regulator
MVVDRPDAQWVRHKVRPDLPPNLPLNLRALWDAALVDDVVA